MRPEFPLLLGLLAGCASDQGTLARLQQAYGNETAAAMAQPVTASVLTAALAADLCVTTGTGSWAEADEGEVPPMEPELLDAMGDPRVGGAVEASALTGSIVDVAMMGGADRSLEFTAVEGEPFLVTGVVSDPEDGVLGSFDYEVVAGCSTQWARLVGLATWTDDTGMEHEVRFPADDQGDQGTDWPGLTAWLPGAGSVSWKGRIDAEERSFIGEDAYELERDGIGATWRGTVSGVEWSADVSVDIQPL